jgi:hypothetical protein
VSQVWIHQRYSREAPVKVTVTSGVCIEVSIDLVRKVGYAIFVAPGQDPPSVFSKLLSELNLTMHQALVGLCVHGQRPASQCDDFGGSIPKIDSDLATGESRN